MSIRKYFFVIPSFGTNVADKGQEIKAIIDFSLSLARLNRDLDGRLKEKNIKVDKS